MSTHLSTAPHQSRKKRELTRAVEPLKIIYGDEVLSHRHFYTLKALQPLLALVSYETDEEPYQLIF